MDVNYYVNLIQKDLETVKMTNIKIKCLGMQPHSQWVKTQDVQYSLTIPSYMYEALVDTEPMFLSYESWKKQKELTGKEPEYPSFKKYIKSFLVSDIIKQIEGLSEILIQRSQDKKAVRSPKLYVKFSASKTNTKDNNFGCFTGAKNQILFQFFKGYSIIKKAWIGINHFEREEYYSDIFFCSGSFVNRYKVHSIENIEITPDYTIHRERDGRPIYGNGDRDRFLAEWKVIDWSQEREDFLNQVSANFDTLSQKLGTFLNDLDTDKLDKLILQSASNQLFLTN